MQSIGIRGAVPFPTSWWSAPVTVCVLSSCDKVITFLQRFLLRHTHARDREAFQFAQSFPLVHFSSYRLGTLLKKLLGSSDELPWVVITRSWLKLSAKQLFLWKECIVSLTCKPTAIKIGFLKLQQQKAVCMLSRCWTCHFPCALLVSFSCSISEWGTELAGDLSRLSVYLCLL